MDCETVECLKNVATAYDKKFDYEQWGNKAPNSNSFVYIVLVKCKFSPEEFPKEAVGWDYFIKNPKERDRIGK